MPDRSSNPYLQTSGAARKIIQIVFLTCMAGLFGTMAARAAVTFVGAHDPPTYSNTTPEMLIESIPVATPGEGGKTPAAGSTDQIAFGFRLQMAGAYQGQLPFWMYSNRYGELDPYSANATMNLFGGWHRQYRSGITLSTGADFLLRGAEDASLRFQEAYVQLGYGSFVLWAGRKREYFGFVHPELSTGTGDLSRNAMPIPKITLATKGFQRLPGTRGIVDYNASIAHGWMLDNEYRFVERPLLHQKHLYLRLFNGRSPVVPQGGVKHFAQWGGTHPEEGPVAADFRAFRDIFFSRSADSPEIVPGGELGNRFQNHVGTYDFSLLFRFDRVRFAISRQFFLEDTPNARFGTPWDGMWGAWVEFPGNVHRSTRRLFAIHALNFEHINTRESIRRIPHRDLSTSYNYHNHWFYYGGWTHGGRAIGNPLFFSDPDHIGVVNNIMLAHHLGASGHAGFIDWRLFATYSRNYGSPRIVDTSGRRYLGVTDRQDQWSFMLELRDRDLFSGLMRRFARELPDVMQGL